MHKFNLKILQLHRRVITYSCFVVCLPWFLFSCLVFFWLFRRKPLIWINVSDLCSIDVNNGNGMVTNWALFIQDSNWPRLFPLILVWKMIYEYNRLNFNVLLYYKKISWKSFLFLYVWMCHWKTTLKVIFFFRKRTSK